MIWIFELTEESRPWIWRVIPRERPTATTEIFWDSSIKILTTVLILTFIDNDDFVWYWRLYFSLAIPQQFVLSFVCPSQKEEGVSRKVRRGSQETNRLGLSLESPFSIYTKHLRVRRSVSHVPTPILIPLSNWGRIHVYICGPPVLHEGYRT